MYNGVLLWWRGQILHDQPAESVAATTDGSPSLRLIDRVHPGRWGTDGCGSFRADQFAKSMPITKAIGTMLKRLLAMTIDPAVVESSR